MKPELQVLSIFLQVFLALALPALIVPAIKISYAYAGKVWREFKEKQPDLAAALEQGANFAVVAAEQAGLGKLTEDKKAYALEALNAWLSMRGLSIDTKLIDAAIEKAVHDNFNYCRTPEDYDAE